MNRPDPTAPDAVRPPAAAGLSTRPANDAVPSAAPSAAEVYWDGEFARGRLLDLPPAPFVDDILAAVRTCGPPPGTGLYIGAGNGRNYLPLLAGGLDLLGLDISAVGLAAIRERAPHCGGRLIHGDLSVLPSGAMYPVVIGIQVFQHGTRGEARALIRSALDRVAPGGLFCVRVNAVGTDIAMPHEVIAEHDDGSLTIRYLPDGGKPGLAVHFHSREGLAGLFDGFEQVLPLRLVHDPRPPEQGGRWARWEVIVRRPAVDASTGDGTGAP